MICLTLKLVGVVGLGLIICQSYGQPDAVAADPAKERPTETNANLGLITRLERNGKTYEFSKTSLEDYEVMEIDGERLCRFNTRLPGNSPGLDDPRLVDLFRQGNEVAMLFYGSNGFYYLHSSKEPPLVGKGQIHLELILLAKDCWHIKNFVQIRDFYPEQMKKLYWDGKVKSAKAVGLNSFEVVPMEGNGGKPDRFSFKIDPSGEAAVVKNGTELNHKVVAGSAVADADMLITQLLDPQIPADHVRDLVISVSDNRKSFIEKLDKAIDDREKLRLVTARIDDAFRRKGE